MRKFDLVIIGGGVAGLVAASGAAQLGARVALVEKGALGGDCLRAGCVPTKRLVRSAKVAALVRRAGEFGIDVASSRVNFSKVMEGVRSIQARVGERDSAGRFMKLGAEVITGSGRFIGPDTFEVNGETLQGRRFLICTGSSPVIIPVPGIEEANPLTNETALMLKSLPPSIAMLGGGPIGMEFAQIFSRLGSEVTVFERKGQILPREDREISGALRDALESEGVRIELGSEIKRIDARGGKKIIYAASGKGEKAYSVDAIMSAAGRSPNVDGLGLEDAGVAFDRRTGIKVDAHLRTSQPHIYGAGDVAGPYAFTHVAEYQAGIALGNALFPLFKRKADYRAVPWATFTDPELARVGLTEAEARERSGDTVSVYRFPFREVDRAVIDGETGGLIKLVCNKKKEILGAHILGHGGGELIHEFALAMKEKVPVNRISQLIHVYPTYSMGGKRACDEYYREKLFSGFFKKAAKAIIRRGG